jgi:hypothetical protein
MWRGKTDKHKLLRGGVVERDWKTNDEAAAWGHATIRPFSMNRV